MDAKELWEYFKETEHYSLQQGKAMEGFMPDWLENLCILSMVLQYTKCGSESENWCGFSKKAYYGLHDLDLDLAVQKVGEI